MSRYVILWNIGRLKFIHRMSGKTLTWFMICQFGLIWHVAMWCYDISCGTKNKIHASILYKSGYCIDSIRREGERDTYTWLHVYLYVRLSQFLRSLENFFLGLYVPQSCFKLEAQLALCCWKPPTTPKALSIDLPWKELLWFAIKHHLVLFDLLHVCNLSWFDRSFLRASKRNLSFS